MKLKLKGRFESIPMMAVLCIFAAGLVAVCLVQKYFHVVKLSSEGYLLSEVPVALGWGWWLALNAGVVAAIVALLVVPACIVSTVKPDESIRYE